LERKPTVGQASCLSPFEKLVPGASQIRAPLLPRPFSHENIRDRQDARPTYSTYLAFTSNSGRVFIINMPTEDDIKNALKAVKYPGFSRDIVSFGLIKGISTTNGAVSVSMEVTANTPEAAQQIKAESERALKALPGINAVYIDIRQKAGAQTPGGAQGPFANQNKVPGIRHIVAVASGKGGVGKSTCSVNLACALTYLGARVGLLDCDIYGPSIPLMMGVNERPTLNEAEKLVPPTNYGVKLMSMGFLLEGDQPVIWRGPMIQKTIQQFVMAVDWGELDFLLVDLPPGTGDAQLSLCQIVPLDGGVIVTTPQEASLGVVRKGIAMFEKVNVPILGIVENMSYFTTPNGERVEIFGHGGGRDEAGRRGIPFLGEIPLFTEIREGGDAGLPVVVGSPNKPPAQAFINIAATLQQRFG
jgi:ATP-binding protein involved in chromosome partitioning